MSITQHELDQFHRFASAIISTGDEDVTWDDLVMKWDSACNRNSIDTAIAEGLQDLREGRSRPAVEVSNELREIHRSRRREI